MSQEIVEQLDYIVTALNNIGDGLWHNNANKFMERVAHVLTSDMFDHDKLNCIRIIYRQLVWPEKPLSSEELNLLSLIR